jgi:general secretion pathway protein E
MSEFSEGGLRVRSGLLGRELRLPLDEVAQVEGTRVRDRRGREYRVSRQTAEAVQAALAPLRVGATFGEVQRELAQRLGAPHAPRRAAAELLTAAQALAASDVHLEPGPERAELRVRLEGALVPLCGVAPETGRRLVAALKGLAGCLPYRTDVVQEGRIGREGVAADVRACFVPTPFGERVALRLFGRLFQLDQLGLEPEPHAQLRQALAAPTGLVLVAGGSGAGKTTTLYAALGHLAAQRTGAHLSVEDPIEQRLRLAGVPVDQVELEPSRGITGEAVLSAALRQDVDVLAVGEIRTAEEAKLAVKAAQTGRLVLAGIHAGSAVEARLRLLGLGVDPAVLDASLRAVLHQQLSVLACGCGSAEGCQACRGSGRRRRLQARLVAAPFAEARA